MYFLYYHNLMFVRGSKSFQLDYDTRHSFFFLNISPLSLKWYTLLTEAHNVNEKMHEYITSFF